MKEEQQVQSALQQAKKPHARSAVVETLAIEGSLDFHALEVLKLELRRLATLCGLEVSKIKVVTVAKQSRRQR